MSNNDSGKGRPGTPPPVPTQRRATTARPEVVQREPSGPTTRRPIVVREIVFGGVTFRIEHDGHNVTVVLPDGTHVLVLTNRGGLEMQIPCRFEGMETQVTMPANSVVTLQW